MIVVKVGGSLGPDRSNILEDFAYNIQNLDEKFIFVHGGGPDIDKVSNLLNLPVEIVRSPTGIESRHTTKETIKALTVALRGFVNPSIVARLTQLGVPAIGLSGVDGCIVTGRRKTAIKVAHNNGIQIRRDGYTGIIDSVNAKLLLSFTDQKLLPVLSPPAMDIESGPINVDADRMAAAVAGAVGAHTLIILTNTPGLLADVNDQASLLTSVDAHQFSDAKILAKGRMKLKLLAAEEALSSGVKKVIIADGRIAKPISAALGGAGTHISATCLEEVGEGEHVF